MTMSEGLNRVTDKMEKLGLVILKDENGEYVARGNRNIKINGENMKPLLAEAVSKLTDCTVINRINITDYIVENNTIKGAYGFQSRMLQPMKSGLKGALCYRRSGRFIQTKQSRLFKAQDVVSTFQHRRRICDGHKKWS